MKYLISVLAMLFAVNFSYAQGTTIPVSTDGTYVMASGDRIKGTYTLTFDAPNRVQTAVLLINANQYDGGSTLTVLSDHSYASSVVMSNFRVLFNSDMSNVYVVFDVANRNGGTSITGAFNGTGVYNPNWGGVLPTTPVVAGTYPLIINNSKIGIGTTTPDQMLTVNGTIHSKEVKVDTSIPVPDYVFDADYKLATLTEVKDYIAKNHHLPEIPSAAQIEKDGLKLGEMNMLLLKKVEELTLHLIERDKQLEAVKADDKKEFDQLKRQLEALTKEIHKN